MSLKFASKTIPGTTETCVYGSPEFPLRRVTYWDVVGEAEIAGRRGGRALVITHLLHDGFAKPTDLQVALVDLDLLVGKHGSLLYTATVHDGDDLDENLKHVTFERYERLPLPGQEAATFLKDFAGTLTDDNGVADEGWFCYLALHFRQLKT
ncbi:MAG: hypothetical protein M3Q42_11775 [Pseudomonadota bacterium]|nr:hypothetical protein [Pseudomonadota bacterium]